MKVRPVLGPTKKAILVQNLTSILLILLGPRNKTEYSCCLAKRNIKNIIGPEPNFQNGKNWSRTYLTGYMYMNRLGPNFRGVLGVRGAPHI